MNNELCEGASGDAAVVRYPRITAKRNVNETTEICERNWVTNPAPFFLVMSFWSYLYDDTPRLLNLFILSRNMSKKMNTNKSNPNFLDFSCSVRYNVQSLSIGTVLIVYIVIQNR